MNTIQKNTETSSYFNNEVGLEINAEENSIQAFLVKRAYGGGGRGILARASSSKDV
jgi:hypothetical protein